MLGDVYRFCKGLDSYTQLVPMKSISSIYKCCLVHQFKDLLSRNSKLRLDEMSQGLEIDGRKYLLYMLVGELVDRRLTEAKFFDKLEGYLKSFTLRMKSL